MFGATLWKNRDASNRREEDEADEADAGIAESADACAVCGIMTARKEGDVDEAFAGTTDACATVPCATEATLCAAAVAVEVWTGGAEAREAAIETVARSETAAVFRFGTRTGESRGTAAASEEEERTRGAETPTASAAGGAGTTAASGGTVAVVGTGGVAAASNAVSSCECFFFAVGCGGAGVAGGGGVAAASRAASSSDRFFFTVGGGGGDTGRLAGDESFVATFVGVPTFAPLRVLVFGPMVCACCRGNQEGCQK